uniref:Uncharacterized protein n=1 Tax=Trichogramma kaykai TaxID=54128 RepID=A0ABD2WCE4_9HYME
MLLAAAPHDPAYRHSCAHIYTPMTLKASFMTERDVNDRLYSTLMTQELIPQQQFANSVKGRQSSREIPKLNSITPACEALPTRSYMYAGTLS